MLLEVAKIKATPEAQPRVSLHYPTVEEYAEALRGDAEFPPLIVFFDGADHWLADGFHRLEAYKMCGYVEVPVDVRKGSKRDAILFSKGANSRHGLPRTNADKRRAVESLLRDEEWGQRSDRWIAEAAAVSRALVQTMRAELLKASQPSGRESHSAPPMREGRDGRVCKLPHQKQAEPAEEGHDGSAVEAEGSPEPGPVERERGAEPASERRGTSRGDGAPARQSRVDGVTVPPGDDPALYARAGYSRRESREIDENVMRALDVAVVSLRDDDWERLMRRIDMKRLERKVA